MTYGRCGSHFEKEDCAYESMSSHTGGIDRFAERERVTARMRAENSMSESIPFPQGTREFHNHHVPRDPDPRGELGCDPPALLLLGGAFWDAGADAFVHKGVKGRRRDTLTPAESAEYETRARAELGEECAIWLATGDGIDP